MRESQAIQRLRRIATSPAALGLADDAALLDGLVLTHDSIAEGVHFLASDPPASVGWKLVAVNLSDLAAKGATPAAALLSLALSGDDKWDMARQAAMPCRATAKSMCDGSPAAIRMS